MIDHSSSVSPALPALARLGKRIRWLVLLYISAVVISVGTATLVWPALLARHPALAGLGFDPDAMTAGGRVAALLALAMPTLPILWAAFEALALCRLVAIGEVFTSAVPWRLRRMGTGLVLGGLLQPVGGALLILAVDRFAGSGTHSLAIVLSSDPIGVAVIGAVLIAIAAAAREAVRLADENARFV